MNAPFTVYIEVEYDPTNEGNYRTKIYSVDCGVADLAFIAQLSNATLLGNEDEILQVVIHHASSLARTAADEHFRSLEELIIHFRSVHFKVQKK